MLSNGNSWAFVVTVGPVLIAVAISCDGSAGGFGDEGFSVQDSSGVSLVFNTAPDRPLAIRETLRFGVLMGDPDLQFDGIRNLAIDSLGGIWVCDSYEAIRHYSASGEYLGQVGGRGQGPGEGPYGYGGVWIGPGSVLAYALGASLQLFDSNGKFLGSRYPIPSLETPRILHPLSPTSSGWLFNRKDFPPPTDPYLRTTWVVGRGPLTTTGFDSLFALDGEPMVLGRGNQWSHGSFFDGTPSIAADAQGRVYYSDPFGYRIEVYSSSGHLDLVIRRTVDVVPYDGGIRGEVKEGARNALRVLQPVVGAREDLVNSSVDKAMPVSEPTHLPALDLVLVSRDGHIWAQRADTHPRPAMRAVAASFGMVRSYWLEEWKAPREFDLFAPTGEYRGSVVLPVEFNPLAVTPEHIYGFTRDSLDVQYVTVFSIEGDHDLQN